MAASVKASTIYKKQNGVLSLAKDGNNIAWTPDSPPNADPYLTIAINDIVSKLHMLPLGRIMMCNFP